MKKIFRFTLVAVIFIAVLGVGIYFIFHPRPPVLPNPNGYDDFVAASRLISGDYIKASELDHSGLRSFLVANGPALQRLRIGLTHKCAAPTEKLLKDISAGNANLANLRHLGVTMAMAGKFAEQENRTNDAIQCYLDTIRYGDELGSGFIINRLIGVACEASGLNPLIKLAPKLSCEQSRAIIPELEKIERNGVTWAEVMRAERSYFWYMLQHGGHPLDQIKGWWENRGIDELARRKHDTINARLRLFTTELALRCYRADYGNAATSLDQLVSKYLQTVPADPYSKGSLVYGVDGTNWQIYSVGFPDTNGVKIPIKVFIPSPSSEP